MKTTKNVRQPKRASRSVASERLEHVYGLVVGAPGRMGRIAGIHEPALLELERLGRIERRVDGWHPTIAPRKHSKILTATDRATRPKMTDVCGKCGMEMGVHQGKRCPKPWNSVSTDTPCGATPRHESKRYVCALPRGHEGAHQSEIRKGLTSVARWTTWDDGRENGDRRPINPQGKVSGGVGTGAWSSPSDAVIEKNRREFDERVSRKALPPREQTEIPSTREPSRAAAGACSARRDGKACELRPGHVGAHLAHVRGAFGRSIHTWQTSIVGGNNWDCCSVRRDGVRCDRPDEHDGAHVALHELAGECFVTSWEDGTTGVGRVRLADLFTTLDVAVALEKNNLGTSSKPSKILTATDRATRAKGKGTKHAPDCSFEASLEQRDPGQPGTRPKIAGYPVHPAAEIYDMLPDVELAELAVRIKARGLLDDLVLWTDEHGVEWLVDGRNRGKACEMAGVKPRFERLAPRAFADLDAVIDYIEDKNSGRRHLTPTQRAAAAARADRMRRGRPVKTGSAAGLSRGKTQAERARKHGASERLVRKAEAVLDRGHPDLFRAMQAGRLTAEAAEAAIGLTKDEQRELAKQAFESDAEIKAGRIRSRVKQAAKRAQVTKINEGKVASIAGSGYRLIVLDPPWPYDNSDQHDGSRGHLGYATMPIEDIERMRAEIDRAAHADVIVGMWITNAFLPVIGRVLAAWGLDHHTAITWAKPRAGVGTWARGQTEHLVIASRGKPLHTLNEVSTLQHWPHPGEHSRKPPQAYKLLAAHCAGPRLEMFARGGREGWDVWGAEADAKAA